MNADLSISKPLGAVFECEEGFAGEKPWFSEKIPLQKI
jgi:hypothetical protein